MKNVFISINFMYYTSINLLPSSSQQVIKTAIFSWYVLVKLTPIYQLTNTRVVLLSEYLNLYNSPY